MPYIYDQLVSAQLENRTSQPTVGTRGLIWFRTDTEKIYVDDGTVARHVPTVGQAHALTLIPDVTGDAPTSGFEYTQSVWFFGPALSQKLYCMVQVPTNYIAGDAINLKCQIYSSATSSTIFLKSVATLIRTGTDAFDSTVNQFSSTNAALTNTTPANRLRQVTLDITSSTGTINSVAVSAGGVIKVQLTRGSDSDIQDMRLLSDSVEVLFQ